MAQESGTVGRLISLGGLFGVSQRGRQLECLTRSVTAPIQILNDNARRIAVIIQNSTSVAATLYFGPDTVGITLAGGANLQIDWNFPWTGTVVADSVGTTIETLEVSVP